VKFLGSKIRYEVAPGPKVGMTRRWSGMDSNFQYAEAVKLLVGAFSCVDCLGRVGAPVGVSTVKVFFHRKW
jgi:hypothetical protein